jgi:signal transduction histidine kinase
LTIRTRLSLWYFGILIVSLAFMAAVVHYEWAEQLDAIRKHQQEPEPAWEEVGEVVLYYGAPTALLLLVGGWLLMRRALAPIEALTGAIERIHVQNLKERLPRNPHGDELDRLTEVFNAMMGRLEQSVEQIRDFTLHASHELKTPLTIMRGELELALREDAPPRDPRELFADQLEEIQRLTKIVDGLALLAKADAGQLSLQRSPVRLKELVEDSFADAQILAQPRKVTVQLTGCEDLTVLGDRNRLRQLLLNLTENAIKYNYPEGTVSMSLTRHNGTAEFKISNTGPGIPPDKINRVFERFYRVDESHNSQMEGCGLGLCIAEWIVKAHNGSLSVDSKPGSLTTFDVRLPVKG